MIEQIGLIILIGLYFVSDLPPQYFSLKISFQSLSNKNLPNNYNFAPLKSSISIKGKLS